MKNPFKHSISYIHSFFKQPTLSEIVEQEKAHELKIVKECTDMILFMQFQRDISEAKLKALDSWASPSMIYQKDTTNEQHSI